MRYLVFVLFLILVIVFAHLSHRGTQERLGEQLVLAAATALQLDSDGAPRDARFRDVRFEVSNLDVVLSGKVASAEVRDELVKLIREGAPVGRIRFQQVQMTHAREPELQVTLASGRASLQGRVPTEDLARRLRQVFQVLGVYVSAQGLAVDTGVNAEDWLNRADSVVARFFEGAKDGEFVLKDGLLRLKRPVENQIDIDLIKDELSRWVPAGRYKVSVEGLTVAAAPKPVELAIRKTEGRWTLHGQLPDQPALESIVRVLSEADAPAQVDGSGVAIDPSLTRPKWLQDGRIERFLRVFASTVRDKPEVIIRQDGVVLRGTASDFIARSNLPSFAGEAFGYGAQIDDSGIQTAAAGQPPAERWLRFDVNPGNVEITGAVPSEQAKQELAVSLKRAFPGSQLKDAGLVVDANAPPMPWLGPLGGYFTELAAMTSQKGTLDVAGNKAYVGGVAKSQWSRSALVGKLEQALGPDFSVYDQLLLDPRGENAAANEAIKIYFGLGSRDIAADQQAKVTDAANRIRAATGGNVLGLIKGYASPGGSAQYNIQLSEARAVAVYEALIARGVNPRVLKILREGVDPNLTGEEARRVEIFIR